MAKVDFPQGFSFYEMLIVLCLISLLLLIAYPQYQSLIRRTDAELMQHEMLQLIHLAQMTAVTKQTPVMLCKSEDGEHCDESAGTSSSRIYPYVLVVTLNADDHPHVEYVSANIKGNLKWRAYPWYREAVLFSPTGTTASDNSTFWYCKLRDEMPTFALFLSKSGHVRVVNRDGNKPITDSKKRALTCVA